jgi:hypothetical protein
MRWSQPPFETLQEFLGHPSLLGLGPLDELLAYEEPFVDAHDAWLHSCVMAYLGEYLIYKFDGSWMVDTHPGSPTFARYLLAARSPESGELVPVDVGEHGYTFMCEPKGRSLLALVVCDRDPDRLGLTGAFSLAIGASCRQLPSFAPGSTERVRGDQV